MLKLSVSAMLLVPVLCWAQTDPPMPDGPGKAVIQKACVGCHNLKVITSKHATHDEWAAIVDQMVSRGAEVSDSDVPVVVQYLADHYGPVKDQKTEPAEPPKPNTLSMTRTEAQELTRVLALSDGDVEASLHSARIWQR
ncbi:hypothetical protein [Granulicella sp. dw_53]|uniref:hypothetical protein n=1 Tax=Granulicella sp. dw_53 TaxID=2719792 RepID=UPI001BD5121E|nr:hypothetical protein [Granulicella sp. dw_53]